MPAFRLFFVISLGITGVICYNFDRALLIFIQANSGSSDLLSFAHFLSSYGRLEWSTIITSVLILIYALLLGKREKYINLAKACFLGGLLAGIAVWPAKTILGRERPRGEGDGQLHFFKFDPTSDSVYYSLPSGHAASTMGSGVAVFLITPTLGVVLIIMSILTGWSRVKLNEHWPSDVIAGWLIGMACGYWIFKKIRKAY